LATWIDYTLETKSPASITGLSAVWGQSWLLHPFDTPCDPLYIPIHEREGGYKMSSLTKGTLNTPNETRTFNKGKVELVTIGGVTFSRVILEPGWK
jgi:hypothetical protein